MKKGQLMKYLKKREIVKVVSIFIVIMFGEMEELEIEEYSLRGNMMKGIYMEIGIMIKIRIGKVEMLKGMVEEGMVNKMKEIIIVYKEKGLKIEILII